MAINYVDKYGKELDQKLVFGTYTNELETPNLLWLDAKTFKIQTITTTGLKAHTRNKDITKVLLQTQINLIRLILIVM
nr:hypothetical protein [Listeria monocytogenes]